MDGGGGNNAYPGGGGMRHPDPRQHDPMQMQILSCQSLEELTNVILLNHFEFNLVHCSTAFNRFATFLRDGPRGRKLTVREQAALKALVDFAKGKQFLPRQASTIMRAIGTGALHLENPDTLPLLESLIEGASFQTWKPMELSHVVEALASLKMKHDGFFQTMEAELAKRGLSKFNAQDITNFLSGYADLKLQAPGVYEMFAKELQSRDLKQDLREKKKSEFESNIFTLQRIVTLLCSFARVGFRPDNVLLDKLANELVTRPLKHLKPSEVANVCWVFTIFDHQPRALFDRLVPEVYTRPGRYTYHQLANIAWAFAKLKLDHSIKFFECIARELKNLREQDADSSSLVNIVWSFSQAGYNAQVLFTKVATELVDNRSLDELTSTQIVSLMWGLARANVKDAVLFDKLIKAIETRSLSEFPSSDIATLAFSLTLLRDSSLCQLIQAELLSRELQIFSQRQLTDTLWSLAQLGLQPHENLYHRIATDISERGLLNLKPRELCDLAWSYSKFAWNDTAMFESIAGTLVQQPLDNFSSRDLANLVRSFAGLGFHNAALFERVAAACNARGLNKNFPNTDVITIAWSLTCNQAMYSTQTRAFFDLVPNPIISQDRTPQNAFLLNQCFLAWKQAKPNESLPTLLEKLVSENWMIAVQQPAAQPKSAEIQTVQKQVSKTLQEMGYIHLLDNYQTSEGLFVSIRLTNNVVLDVSDSISCQKGDAVFKRRLLEHSGFYVAYVLTSEWQALVSEKDREEFLGNKLASLSSSSS